MAGAAATEDSALRKAVRLAEEQEIRLARERSLTNIRYFAELLHPPDDPDKAGFWSRFSEPVEWMFELFLAWKSRGTIEILPGFELIIAGKSEVITRPRLVDLTRFNTLMIRQSRETLKTGTRRIDFQHDLAYWPLKRGMLAACVWYGHKLEMAEAQCENIKEEMCKSDPFNRVWGGVLVPEHRNPKQWGKMDPATFNTPMHPLGAPEPSAMFLAVKSRYEGGRYRGGHFDDLVTGDDRDSQTVRESKAQNLNDRENERDRTCGIKTIQGTDHHPDDAYQRQQKKRGTITVKMPCIARGTERAFFDFCDLQDEDRYKPEVIKKYTEICKPVFGHLPLQTLAETCDDQGRLNFSCQMLLAPELGGSLVFNKSRVLVLPREVVQPLLIGIGFIVFDEAWKLPENKYQGDNAAIGYWAWDRHGRRVLWDGRYGNDMEVDEAYSEISRLATSYPTDQIYTENQSVLAHDHHWKNYAFTHNVPISALTPLERAGKAVKHSIILAAEPYVRRGEIVLIKDLEITDRILEEMDGYDKVTGASGPDDGLNMLAMTVDPLILPPIPGDDQNRASGATVEVEDTQDEEWEDGWLP